MEPQAATDFLIGQMRVLTMPALTYFYVTNQPVPFADLDKDFDPLLDKLCEAQALAHIPEAGPEITRYYKVSAGEPDLYLMETGVSVKPGTLPAGEALVRTLPPYRCAALMHWGGLLHLAQSYAALSQAVKAAGLQPTGECREWNFYFESVESPNDLIGLYMGIF
jgi:effector-binding domain-containing protein